MSLNSNNEKPKAKDQRPKTSEIVAIILAAGQSKRMGAFKPLLPFGDKTVIENCIDYLQQGGVQTIVVVLGHRGEEIKERLSSLPIQFAQNPNSESEMSESIACGVRELPSASRATFIAPADYPAVAAEAIVTLTKTWEQGSSGFLIPEYEGRGGHPVLVDLCFRNELLHLDSSRGLRALFDIHRDRLCRVPVDSPFIARDIDTWDDYRALHREVFGTEPPDVPLGGQGLQG